MARILVIDDDIQICEMLSQMLQKEGFEVAYAENGIKAGRIYRAILVDLVITDIIMPDKEGLETIVELRRDFPDIKIIAISGGGRVGPEPYLKMAKSMGAMFTFVKPIDRGELLDAIQKALGSEKK
jgi:DNA-binding NtrC family response regulator